MQTEHYRITLEAELTQLEHDLRTLGVHDPRNTQNWTEMTADIAPTEADVLDVADKTEEWIERRGTLAQLEKRYNNLIRALEKIEKGTYGICEISGDPIEVERLEANPAARTCIAHKDREGELL